jgi:hypothetical protein
LNRDLLDMFNIVIVLFGLSNKLSEYGYKM